MEPTTLITYNGADYTCTVEIDGTEHDIGTAPNYSDGYALCEEYLYQHWIDTWTPEMVAKLVLALA